MFVSSQTRHKTPPSGTFISLHFATQCYSCNKFHHTAENCHITPRCLKCREAHDCVIKRVEKTYCINCHVYGHMANYSKCPLFPKPSKGSKTTTNNYSTVVDNIIRPNTTYAQATANKNTIANKNAQPMTTLKRGNPGTSRQNQANRIINPSIIQNFNPEDNSAQAIILQTLQHTRYKLSKLLHFLLIIPPTQPKKGIMRPDP
ncbi:hypothetical protein TNCV_5099351 [Trichonephila clavipes]|uniref:Nucleic-acid-binding protein from transposon X-element n=1 Tax=Trichonephila clavipes TaxID=2585209 RepID=A0A8X6V7E0_TRICX|nr:hypothetical protein TNCV_5099351 [Trichonephila clavipes]